MAIRNFELTTEATDFFVSPGESIAATIFFCNRDEDLSRTVSLWIVPNGETREDKHQILHSINLIPTDTFELSDEKIILEEGDTLWGQASKSNIISVTISYMGI